MVKYKGSSDKIKAMAEAYNTQGVEAAKQVGNSYNNGGTVYTPETTNNKTNTFTYGDKGGASYASQYTGIGTGGGGGYTYNPNLKISDLSSDYAFGTNAEAQERQSAGYLENRNNYIANALFNEGKRDEQAVRNYLNTFQDYRDYDKVGQDNTVQAILNRMGKIENSAANSNQGGYDYNSQLMSEVWNNYDNANKGYSDLMGGGDNYYTNFWDAVNGKLQTAYGIQSLDEFKSRYPEQYQSLMQSLESVEGVRNASDPNSRQMLDGALQGIIGSGVGAGSDWSKLSVLEESVLNKFKNPEQIKSDAQNVIKLQTEGKSVKDIANAMNMSEDQVQQLILLANGLDSKAGEYYQLTDKASKDITEPYDTKIARLEEEKRIALERANRNVERLKEDFDTNMERQKQQNDINAHNADAIAGRTGLGFSKRGIEGINYVNQQAQQLIDDLTKNYDRNKQEMADGISDIIRNWQWNNEDLNKAMQDALTNAKNSFTSNMLAIQQQYGTVGLQAQQALSNNVQAFIEQAEAIYDNGLTRQQQNLSNLITNISNLNALAYNDLTLRNAKIQQFQSESMNLNRNQLQSLATQLGMDTASYQDLANYQIQAVANELNGYVPGAGVQFQSQISDLLNSGYTPNQAMQSIMNSAEFKQLTATSGGGDNWSMSGGIMYNKSTGEYYDLNGDEYGTIGDNLYNKRTGEIISGAGTAGGGMSGTNGTQYVSSETIDGETYGVSQNTYQGLVNFYNKYADENGNIKTGVKGGQCGAFVNNYLQSLGLDRVFQDPIDKKKAAINTPDGYQPQIGDVAVMNSPTKSDYGHVAIVIGVNEDGTITTLESNKAGEGEVFTRTIDPTKEKTKVFGYYHPDGAVGKEMSQYDLNTATMRIGKMAYGKNISDSEGKRVEETIKEGMKSGKSTTDILYDILGMTITNNKDKAEPFIDILIQNSDADGLSAYNVQGFADFINKGQIVKAMNMVEQAVAKERGGSFAQDLAGYENGAKYAYEKGNELIDLINKETSKLGIVAGNVTKWKSKFMKDENYQKIASAIVNYVADWRHEMLGAATTATELKMIDDLLPSVTDNPYNAIVKIQEFQDYWLRKYNNTRGNLYLPAVNETTLLDNNQRVKLYTNGKIYNTRTGINAGGQINLNQGTRL